MSDWQIGDLAVCVDDGPLPTTAPDAELSCLKVGHTYRVIGLNHTRWLGLHIEGGTDGRGYKATRFRKIRPDTHEGNVEDWQLLRETHKRKVSA